MRKNVEIFYGAILKQKLQLVGDFLRLFFQFREVLNIVWLLKVRGSWLLSLLIVRSVLAIISLLKAL